MRFVVALVLAALSTAAVRAADYSQLTGQELYKKFCASCHGLAAKGDGPIAASLKTPPADLTSIASRYGSFPAKRIEEVIDGRIAVNAHGSSSMPVWGEEFTRAQSGKAEAERSARTAISKIADYLRSVQRPQ